MESFDTHGPICAWIVTADEIGDPHWLELRTWVNGELRQHSNTRELVFDCFAQVETLTSAFTLLPGTIVSTGIPGGVSKIGDLVKIEIDRIGHIENRIVGEPASTDRI